ncbi:type II secretion system F family protein [Arthrobacter sp. MPF02]|uniref:type II secretion system F family protein n=1 Tax=Arthrobacter sp. MPF02 TaxID=3388492 RepID=UPI003984BB88
MILLLAAILGCAVVLLLKPPRGAPARLRFLAGKSPGQARTAGRVKALPWVRPGTARKRNPGSAPMTLLVQQLAALLKGGRTPGRLWDELWMLYAGGESGHRLPPGSVTVLAAARAAAAEGAPVSAAIRKALPGALPVREREAAIWSELAACLDIAEASGCPLAGVLTRFAAQLEVEDDADAARQTALAGPKATVRLLTWLPLMGLGLGAALGVDPLAILLGTPLGLAALAAGVGLTVAGRIWSARLVAVAAGGRAP